MTVVMKFGGTSLATAHLRDCAAERVREARESGQRIVVVVSAMGRLGEPYATDTLLRLLEGFCRTPAREIDALTACGEEISAAYFAALLNDRGVKAVSLRGSQAGIITNGAHGDAEIREIRIAPILDHLNRGEVVVVAGFQGVTDDGEVTTLGRGGSDTTAVALAAALPDARAEIYTDVDGVLSADPRVVDGARAVEEVTYEESAELARKGARVLHPRAAERARASGVAVEIRNTCGPSPGTRLVPDEGRWSDDRELPPRTTAVTSIGQIAQVVVAGERFFEDPARLENVFARVAARGISLDMLSIGADQAAFTVAGARAPEISEALADLDLTVRINPACSKVTLVGGGIHGIPGVMHRMVRALARAGIGIHQSVDSNMIISVLVDADREEDAVRALHAEFFG